MKFAWSKLNCRLCSSYLDIVSNINFYRLSFYNLAWWRFTNFNVYKTEWITRFTTRKSHLLTTTYKQLGIQINECWYFFKNNRNIWGDRSYWFSLCNELHHVLFQQIKEQQFYYIKHSVICIKYLCIMASFSCQFIIILFASLGF